MSWAFGYNAKGRKVGYAVDAICDLARCFKVIDHGLAYCCGGMHDGGEHGCGGYFCEEHLYHTGNEQGESPGAVLCKACADKWDTAHPDE